MNRTALLLVASSLAGCAAAESTGGESQSLRAAGEAGFYEVLRRDPRECAAPACGGFFVKMANEETTPCGSSSSAECYVAEIALERLGLPDGEEASVVAAFEAGKAVVRGRMVSGTLEASEVWTSPNDVRVTGALFRVGDNGTRCMTTPCPSTSAWTLNGEVEHPLFDVDLAATESEAHHLDRAEAAIATEAGLLVAGRVLGPECTAATPGCGTSLAASTYFFRVTREDGACEAGGCTR